MPEDHHDDGKLGDSLDLMNRVWAVDHALNGLSRIMESRLGITGPQRLIVRVIGRRPGVSAGDLADTLHLDPSTLTGHLKRLLRAGLIKRRLAPDDGRRFELRLTQAGARKNVATPGTVEAAVSVVEAAFSTREIALAGLVLGALAQELKKQAEAVEDRPLARRRKTARKSSARHHR